MKHDLVCGACGGDPKVKYRDGMIDKYNFKWHFVGNMTMKEADKKILSISGRIDAKGDIYHAYTTEKIRP